MFGHRETRAHCATFTLIPAVVSLLSFLCYQTHPSSSSFHPPELAALQ